MSLASENRISFVSQVGTAAQPPATLQCSAHWRGRTFSLGIRLYPQLWLRLEKNQCVTSVCWEHLSSPTMSCYTLLSPSHHLLFHLTFEALMGCFLPPFAAAPFRLRKTLCFHPGSVFTSSACLVWCGHVQPANKASSLYKETWFYLLHVIFNHTFDF